MPINNWSLGVAVVDLIIAKVLLTVAKQTGRDVVAVAALIVAATSVLLLIDILRRMRQ